MTMIAFVMFISLLLLIANSFDPRVANKSDIAYMCLKLSIGAVLGFVIILMYGVGFPGLKYFFMVIGFGGVAHLFLSGKTSETFNV